METQIAYQEGTPRTDKGEFEVKYTVPATANCPEEETFIKISVVRDCLLYTSPSPRDQRGSRMPSSA